MPSKYCEKLLRCKNAWWCTTDYKPSKNVKCFDAMTNADRIRAMTDEELADFIARQRFSAVTKFADILGVDITTEFIVGRKNAFDWLKKEAAE